MKRRGKKRAIIAIARMILTAEGLIEYPSPYSSTLLLIPHLSISKQTLLWHLL